MPNAYHNAVRFDAKINEFAEKFGVSVNVVLRSTSMRIFRNVVEETPIDTGRARGSWNIDINFVDLTKLPEDKDGPFQWQSISQNKALIFQQKELDAFKEIPPDVYIANSLSYIKKLNEGHSKRQQPIPGYIQRIFERWADYINSSVSNVGT